MKILINLDFRGALEFIHLCALAKSNINFEFAFCLLGTFYYCFPSISKTVDSSVSLGSLLQGLSILLVKNSDKISGEIVDEKWR